MNAFTRLSASWDGTGPTLARVTIDSAAPTCGLRVRTAPAMRQGEPRSPRCWRRSRSGDPASRCGAAYVDVQEPLLLEALAGAARPVTWWSSRCCSRAATTSDRTSRQPSRRTGAPAPRCRWGRTLRSPTFSRRGSTRRERLADDAVVLAAAGSSDPAAVEDVERMAALLRERLGRAGDVRLRLARPSPASRTRSPGSPGQGRRVALAAYLLAPGHFLARLARDGSRGRHRAAGARPAARRARAAPLRRDLLGSAPAPRSAPPSGVDGISGRRCPRRSRRRWS